MKIQFRNILLLVAFSLSFNACKSNNSPKENLNTIRVEYLPSDAMFPNPERGFYKFSRIDLTTASGALSPFQLDIYRKNNITLVNRMFYLKKFKDSPLSQAALDEIERDFVSARNGGVKLIVRFAYSESQTESDAPMHIIKQHLDQLKPVLEKNSDVIATIQAGLIGAWGEWYYSTNGLNNNASRNEVLKKLLDSSPKSRSVQVRTPAYKQRFTQRTTPLTEEEAFNGSDIARIGHHNDCFLASTTDYGTYSNPTTDKAFLNQECLFVPIGGETCPPTDVGPATAVKAQEEMRYLRWSYLNEDYYKGVNDTWIAQGGMNNIIRELGYRFQLSSGDYSNEVKPGGIFTAKIHLKNLGYAPLYNERHVELILKNTDTGEVYKSKLDVDPRFWQPLEDITIDTGLGIPQNLPEGYYDLYLNLPDSDSKISSDPRFSIRMANENMWDEKTGYNKLNAEIHVSSNNKSANYKGSQFFVKQ